MSYCLVVPLQRGGIHMAAEFFKDRRLQSLNLLLQKKSILDEAL